MMRCLVLAAALALTALLLEGCGEAEITTTTTTTTPTTTPTTTSSTITTSIGHYDQGDCTGRDASTVRDEGEKCFCYYTGHCTAWYHCPKNEPLPMCQLKNCGSKPIKVDDFGAAFMPAPDTSEAASPSNTSQSDAFHDPPTILTIPSVWFLEVTELISKCKDKGQATMERLMQMGRDVHEDQLHTKPQWQCVHLHHHLGVGWLHLHTFAGFIKKENLPCGGDTADWCSCAEASLSVSEAASKLLSKGAATLRNGTSIII